MELGERLHRWWDRVRGLHDEEPATASPGTRLADEQAAREIRPVDTPSGRSELKLSVEGKPEGAGGQKSHSGSAGFDPYSSDAGYSKPHGWEDTPRK